MLTVYFRIVSIPNLKSFWYYSLYKPPFRVRSGEFALNCPGPRVLIVTKCAGS